MRSNRIRAVAVAAVVLVGGQAAWAQTPVGPRLDRARAEQRQALATLHAARASLALLRGRVADREEALGAASTLLHAALQRESDAELRLAVARDQLNVRVRAAYEAGPATTLSLLLSAQSPADLVSIGEFTSSVLAADSAAVDGVVAARAELAAATEDALARWRSIRRGEQDLAGLFAAMREKVAEAERAAGQAGRRVDSLEREKRAIEAAAKRQEDRQQQEGPAPAATPPPSPAPTPDPGTGGTGGGPGPPPSSASFDQAALLALLGPSGGRTCETPAGLRETGQSFSGQATWYGGAGVDGHPTASGVAYDPALFTAAHRTLPFGVFLRVRFRSRCAVVLVNDRGPYGDYQRVVDLSQAAARYLGLGVGEITVDVLVPA